MALARASHALDIYLANDAVLVMPTGGQGDHFNRTDRMHSDILADHLELHGVHPDHIVQVHESSNTVEDLMEARQKLQELQHNFQVDSVTAVTSDYHLRRVELILDTHFFKEFGIEAVGVYTDPLEVGEGKLRELKQHEKRAVDQLVEIQQGLEWDGEIHEFLSEERSVNGRTIDIPNLSSLECEVEDRHPPLQP